MTAHTFQIEGLGNVTVSPLNFKEQEFPYCDANGQPLKRTVIGKGRTAYLDQAGQEVPSDMAYKLINNKVVKKFKKTEKVTQYAIQETAEETTQLVERAFYKAFTDNAKIKELVSQGKTLKFTYTNGNGYKLQKAFLTNYAGTLMMILGRGNLSKMLETCTDETLTLETGTEQLTEKEMEAMIE